MQPLRIALVGHGKMGRAIAHLATASGDSLSAIIHRENAASLTALTPATTDVVIEFTHPASVLPNLQALIPLRIPIVVGTTGWLHALPAIEALCAQHGTPLVYGANYSVGVNLLFALNKRVAQFMNQHPTYDVYLEERHHRHKADAPSGTALKLAADILEQLDRKTELAPAAALAARPPAPHELSVGVSRAGEITGTHSVTYTSAVDSFTLRHEAYSREGFAHGALYAARWLQGRLGVHAFEELFSL